MIRRRTALSNVLAGPPVAFRYHLELRDGGIGVASVPGAGGPRQGGAGGAPWLDHGRPQGIEAGLEETYYWEPSTVTWSYAAHVAIVEVDRELGRIRVEKYAIVVRHRMSSAPSSAGGPWRTASADPLGRIDDAADERP